MHKKRKSKDFMQQITLIGRVTERPEETLSQGRKALRFRLRAGNSPADGELSSFVFTVLTGRLSLRDSLTPGTEVLVTGLLSLSGEERTEATVQALVTHVISRADRSAEEAAMEMLSGGIPLQGI